MEDQNYDIIFAGAGLSGLTLALELVRRPAFRGKRILLLDRDNKKQNDRTWCFWATEDEPLPPVIYRSWELCRFYSPGYHATMDISPYRYCMVRGIDFYKWATSELAKHPNVCRVQTNITGIDTHNGHVQTGAGTFSAACIFNSAFTKIPVLPEPSPLYPNPPFTPGFSGQAIHRPLPGSRGRLSSVSLLQHFKGWLIETPVPAFDSSVLTFMDFRIEQHGETRFVYVLPLTETTALVEFTVFSPALLTAEEYELALQNYVSKYLEIKDFRIIEEEFGVIPMTDYPFPRAVEGKVIHIGTAGGFVKASSGYAFKRTQRKIRNFVDAWERKGHPDPAELRSAWIFRAFDSIFLHVLANQNELGRTIFTDLFQNLPSTLVLRFLDEDSTSMENLRLVSAPPALPFLRAMLKQLPGLHQI